MLFNSYAFIFLFLIPVALVYRFIRPRLRVWFLIAASVLFYAQWNLGHLVILLGSVGMNFAFTRMKAAGFLKGYAYLAPVVIANLIPLFVFKYSNFLGVTRHDLILPLAISFFTFQQIAFQVQLCKNIFPSPRFREYLFFVMFFPQLVAGPIVKFKELICQIPSATAGAGHGTGIQNGVVLFSLGLFKKVLLADQLAPLADRAFAAAGGNLPCLEAWAGILAYTFQIYFDFSGYADMAVGLGLMFGFRLPANFNSPYKAVDFIDFWRRWHITLSQFLKTHIYIPLGGNRNGRARQALSLMATMVLGGIWHGAGWTFILWGGFHGLFLMLNHFLVRMAGPKYRGKISAFATFLTVTLLWVFFRAPDATCALAYYRALVSFEGAGGLSPWEAGLILCCFSLVWAFPNSLAAANFTTADTIPPRTAWAWMSGLFLFCVLKALSAMPARTFVYFNF